MDLRGMLNDNGPAASAPSKPPQPPPQLSLPSTPIQAPSHGAPFRDFGHTQPSPGRHMSMDYSMQQVPAGAYGSPPPYQAAGPYPNRPAPPPPLQQVSANDLRSPSIASGPGPSPYRATPTSSISAQSAGYPFPPQQTPTSPVQRHQYPPAGVLHHRDSYPQPGAPVGMTGPPGAVSYMHAQHVPQTPPVGTPGSYIPKQRTHSTHSTPTPSSAQSQHAQYGAPFNQVSPVAATHSLSQMDIQQRILSQPPTPVAAPLTGPRPAQTMSFGQPPSPYQQRIPPTTINYPHPPSQRSPPPPHPPSLSRHPSQTIYDPLGQDPHRRSQSQSQSHHGDSRDRSISVSPKTRVPSLPSNAGRPGTSLSDLDSRHAHVHPISTMPSALEPERERERAPTPATKRKLDDRELRPDELERREVRPPPFENVNGRGTHGDAAPPSTNLATMVSKQAKRKVYQTPPVWAQSLQGQPPTIPTLPYTSPSSTMLPPLRSTAKEKRAMSAVQGPPLAQPPAQPAVAQAPPAPAPPPMDHPLGQWEPSIMNEIPQEGMLKTVADFLFSSVILNEDRGEIQSRGVQFEIEAKLGILIDKSTNHRVKLPTSSECVLSDAGNWLSFRSSMTEAQHQAFNQYLNEMVVQSHPDAPANKTRPRPRVEIKYKHRREVDKFVELPNNIRDQMLPSCVSGPISSMGRAAKVRITYDQKSKEVLAKIIKVRVADLSLHFPDSPLDCRISVNLEMDWDGPTEDLERLGAASNRPPPPSRNKDRLSYKQSHYQVDLTQVTQMIPGVNNTQKQEKEHELEIEVAPEVLIDQGKRAMEGLSHGYVELVEGLVNNIRLLTRKAKDFDSMRQ
ncbi:CYTH-like domain-containing protein [Lasiosphaeris hirsuta]|uniref:mRNA-capping enzyme subunit beta n=1 Tax=Lasiosphaeris hirsuta TaxID=260670 RepID=A0AA40B044_9PEZI|nr:CYTH-like domain-containing protein [Lasiosphaeris hirsuta]